MSPPDSVPSSFHSVLQGTPNVRATDRLLSGGNGSDNGAPERVIARFRSHARRLIVPSFLLILLCGATGFFAGRLPEPWQNTAVLILAAVLVLVVWIFPLVSWLASRYTVTTKRLIVRRGFWVSTRQEIPFNRGYDISVSKSWLQVLFRSGDVRIVRAPGQVAVLRDIPQADLVMTVMADLLEDGVVWASTHRPVMPTGAPTFSAQNATDPRGTYFEVASQGAQQPGPSPEQPRPGAHDGPTTVLPRQ